MTASNPIHKPASTNTPAPSSRNDSGLYLLVVGKQMKTLGPKTESREHLTTESQPVANSGTKEVSVTVQSFYQHV